MPEASLTITSRNYGSWSLRGRLPCAFAGRMVDAFNAAVGGAAGRAELGAGRRPISFRAHGETEQVEELDAEF